MKKGFTLLELLIVMVIIGFLITMSGLAYQGSLVKARDARRKDDLRNIQVALETYKNVNGHYPDTDTRCRPAHNWKMSTDTCAGAPRWISELTSTYIKTLPIDPVNTDALDANIFPYTVGEFAYAYLSSTGGFGCDLTAGEYYILTTHLENPQDREQSQGPFKINDTCLFQMTGKGVSEDLYVLMNP